MEDEMRKRRRTLASALLGLLVTATVAAGCNSTIDHGVPMGGRDYDGKPPYSVSCDPNGVKMFQPDACK
jgi:hypothetical protein